MLLNAHMIEIDTLQPFIFSSHENLKKKIIVGTIVVSCFMDRRGAAAAAWNKEISKKRRVRRIW